MARTDIFIRDGDNQLHEELTKWCASHSSVDGRSQWFPFYDIRGISALKVVIQNDADAILFKLKWSDRILPVFENYDKS
jgi:hypothetical protein